MKQILTSIMKPVPRISFGLMMLTLSIILIAQSIGLLPDRTKLELETRIKVAEALAIQLATAAAGDDLASIIQTIELVVQRDKSIISIALRKADDEVLTQAGDHASHWIDAKNNQSTPTRIQVPLFNANIVWGKVEMVFVPLAAAHNIGGVSFDFIILISFLGTIGFVGYFLILRRALREIDPSRTVPPRVQAAFNALCEGVMIIDQSETIVLANTAISNTLELPTDKLFGKKTSDLAWRQWATEDIEQEFPWRTAIRGGETINGAPMTIRTSAGELIAYSVNAAPIADTKDRVQGAIVTFNDVTDLQMKNEQLGQAISHLENTQLQINRQNRELEYLATRDPLTGCLNRRSFFAKFETYLKDACEDQRSLSVLMVDIDHFKLVNDTFGHSAGDEVIVNVGNTLKSCCREQDLVGRYGGEEFCVVLVGLDPEQTSAVAERVRGDLHTKSSDWLKSGKPVSASIGVSMLTNNKCTPQQLVDQADRALYEAKTRGRNQVVLWDQIELQPERPTVTHEPTSTPTREPVSAALRVGDTSSNKEKPGTGDGADINPEAITIRHPTSSQPYPLTPDSVLIDRISNSISRAKRHNKMVAVMQLTLASYDQCVDAFGGEVVQGLIDEVASRINGALRQSDTVSLLNVGLPMPTVALLPDTKFAIEIPDAESTIAITWIAKRIRDALSHVISYDDQEIIVDCSIGVSVYPSDGENPRTLYEKARTANRFCAENMIKNGCSFYSEDMNEISRKQILIETGLRKAIENDEFSLVYQPILDIETGGVTSAEVLLRCEHESLRGIGIQDLIVVAEKTGLIVEIGENVLLSATRQLESWMKIGLSIPKLSVNLSPIQLRDSSAAERLIEILGKLDFPARMIQFEFTETAMMNDVSAVRERLRRMQKLGVQIALDDFGTGHSALSHLREFSPDVLKIDRSFVGRIGASHTDTALVSAIIAMSHELGIRVVAEGIETQAQLDQLRKLNCDDFQGYLCAKPMSATQMTKWLRRLKNDAKLKAA